MTVDGVVELSRREQAKDGRRRRIVQAALDLLREGDPNNITVSMIADRAHVNAMTIYNLFGTKAAVLARVYENDLDDFAARVKAANSTDALERIFDALNIATQMYAENPDYYRVMLSSSASLTDEGLARTTQGSRIGFWRVALQDMLDEGHLRRDADLDLLAMLLIQMTAGAISLWGGRVITLEELDAQIKCGFATLILPSARREAAARLKDRVERLRKDWRALAAAMEA